MAQSLVIGNWKMHGSLSQNQQLIESIAEQMFELDTVKLAVCPPDIYLAQILLELDANELPIALGAQNVCAESPDSGAFTGECAAAMLADLDISYALVGHSERRQYYAESDATVLAKFQQLIAKNISPVLCLGENLAQREAGDTLAVVKQQLCAVFDAVDIDAMQHSVIAYEPVWAIGTGKTATPAQAQEVHAFIREQIANYSPAAAEQISLLYGGSVKADNAADLFAQADIDGALVGGAALNADQFLKIAKAAESA